MRTGGRLIVDCLEAQGTERVFCVPGESYLAVLDALHDSPIQTVVARQEGGAAMMSPAMSEVVEPTAVPAVKLAPRSISSFSSATRALAPRAARVAIYRDILHFPPNLLLRRRSRRCDPQAKG